MRPSELGIGLLILSMVFTACADEQSGYGRISTTVENVDGVQWVRNAGTPDVWLLRERLTLGSLGGDASASPDEFGRIASVIADGAGNIYVADAQAIEIRVFDSSGRFLRRIGRRGAGPGEFGHIQSIGWIGDTLAVLDPANGRLGLFDLAGAWLGHREYLPLSGSGLRLRAAGPRDLYMPSMKQIGDRWVSVFVRQTPLGARDTLSGFDNALFDRADRLAVRCTHSGGRGISVYSADIGPRAIVEPAPDAQRMVLWSSDYRITFLDSMDDTVRVIERDLRGEPLDAERWRREEEKFQNFLDLFSDASCQPSSLPRPERPRVIEGLWFDDTGRLWVERHARNGREFDLFDSSGRLRASLKSPPRLDRVQPFVRKDRVYLVVTDSLEVEYVKVFDVVNSPK